MKISEKVCAFESCDRPRYGRKEYCHPHYNAKVQGRPLRPMPERRHEWKSGRRRTRAEILERRPDGTKRCIGCTHWLPEGAYPSSAATVDGLSATCTICLQAARHGLTRLQLERIITRSTWRCAICGGEEKLVIDHDHSHCAGQKGCADCVRGILCTPCNVGLGTFRDDVERLLDAASYLLERRIDA